MKNAVIKLILIVVIILLIPGILIKKFIKKVKKGQRKDYFLILGQKYPFYKDDINKLLENRLSKKELIDLYRKFFIDSENTEENYPLLCQIIIALKKDKAFPPEVEDWLDDPNDFLLNDLIETMNEFIAIYEHHIDSKTAVMAFGDGFLSLNKALEYVDRYRYPKTIELMKSGNYDTDDLRESIKQDEKEYNSPHNHL